ncbi:MAG: SpoIIE family protein phosphatase [Bryobacteraceae bacterium]|nr:SpoIIE family protein phosphatase [Bryobacteraceae bacterium]
MPDLRIRATNQPPYTIKLEKPSYLLGRASANDLPFPEDGGLSRQHLILERAPSGLWSVRDLGSKNGSLLNGNRITEATALKAGDRIACGHLVLEFDPVNASSAASNQTVVFVAGDQTDSRGTIFTSLKGVLEESTASGVAEQRQVSQHIDALVRAGRELAGHRPLNELFEVILKLAIDAVGGTRGLLLTLEQDELLVRAARGEDFRISTFVREQVITLRQSLLVRDTQSDEMLKNQMTIMEQRVRSLLAVPLQTNEKVIGLLYLDSPGLIKEFSRADLNLLTVLANVAAIRIEHARLNEIEAHEKALQRELEQAADIQRGLLPSEPPVVPGLDLAGFNAACRTVGGDYYDFFPYAGDRVAILVGDVAGKGMPAALLMSSIQARVQILAEEGLAPAALVTRLNRALCQRCPSNRFVTFFFAVLDPATGQLTYTNAGHNPPYIIRANGAIDTLESTGIVLGLIGRMEYGEGATHLDAGDRLVLFSDGVTEATSVAAPDDEFGEDRLIACLRTPGTAAALIDHVLQTLAQFTQGAPQHDDVTMVVAQRGL